MAGAKASQAAASPSLARRLPLGDVRLGQTLEDRVGYFFQIVDKSEALLLEEIGDLRARVQILTPSWTIGGHDADGGVSRWQDVQVYLHERRLEQAAIAKLLASVTHDETNTYEVEVEALRPGEEAKTAAMADPSPHDHERRIAELENSNDQLADHVQALDTAVGTLRRRLGTTSQITMAPHASLVGQDLHAIAVHSPEEIQRKPSHRLDQGLQPHPALYNPDQRAIFATASQQYELQKALHQAHREKLAALEALCAVEQRHHSDLKSLHNQLGDAQRKQDEQVEVNAMLRATIATLRETNGSLLHRLHVKNQHLHQCWERINKLWE